MARLHPLRRVKTIYNAEKRIEHQHNVRSRGEAIAAGLLKSPPPYDTASDAGGSRKYNPLRSLVPALQPRKSFQASTRKRRKKR